MASQNLRAAELRESLSLLPHPEGGCYREVFRSPSQVTPTDGRGPRSALTAIYFLLEKNEFSAWHVVTSDECWHYTEGAALELFLFDPRTNERRRVRLGSVSDQQQPLVVVPAGVWQAARPLGDYTLVQCTVGPGFAFEDFQLIRDLPEEETEAIRHVPDEARLL